MLRAFELRLSFLSLNPDQGYMSSDSLETNYNSRTNQMDSDWLLHIIETYRHCLRIHADGSVELSVVCIRYF